MSHIRSPSLQHLGILVGVLLCGGAAACGTGSSDPEQTTGAAPVVKLCLDGDEREERHGTDCLCCHVDEFSVAGSIAADETRIREIRVRDTAGSMLVMAPNPYKNFFRHTDVTPPLIASVVGDDGKEHFMQAPVPHGSCNRCHDKSEPAGLIRLPPP